MAMGMGMGWGWDGDGDGIPIGKVTGPPGKMKKTRKEMYNMS